MKTGSAFTYTIDLCNPLNCNTDHAAECVSYCIVGIIILHALNFWILATCPNIKTNTILLDYIHSTITCGRVY